MEEQQIKKMEQQIADLTTQLEAARLYSKADKLKKLPEDGQIDNWIEEVERVKVIQKLSDEVLARKVLEVLSKSEIHMIEKQQSLSDFIGLEWSTIKKQLIDLFGVPQQPSMRFEEMKQIQFKPGDSMRDFFMKKSDAISTLGKDYTGEVARQLILDAIPESYKLVMETKYDMAALDDKNLLIWLLKTDQLMKMEERVKEKEKPPPIPTPPPRTPQRTPRAAATSSSSVKKTAGVKRRPMICGNCGKRGHGIENCWELTDSDEANLN